MTNETRSTTEGAIVSPRNFAVVVVLPLLFALALVILLTIACLLPRCNRGTEESKETRKQKRLEKLNATVRTEHFAEWASKEQKLHPDSSFCSALCVICLDEFDEASQIRGLGCHHVFHQTCLDDWFGRWNEYCPLCHRRIIPGDKQSRRSESSLGPPPPVGLMV